MLICVLLPAAGGTGLLPQVRALIAATGAVVSHLSAAVLWGFPLPVALECRTIIHLTTRPGRRAVRRRDAVGHQQKLGAEEITTGCHVSCTSPLRTWFDLAGILELDDLVIAGDFLVRRKNPLTSIRELEECLASKQGRPGYRRALRARALIRAGTTPVRHSGAATSSGMRTPGMQGGAWWS